MIKNKKKIKRTIPKMEFKNGKILNFGMEPVTVSQAVMQFQAVSR